MIILGIDPGTARTGYGVVRKSQRGIDFVACGCIKTSPDDSPENRLNQIFNQVNGLIKDFSPDALSVERLFFFKNAKTAIPVSQARGVILLAGERKKIPIYEFTPLEVKMNIVGYGRAQKMQMQKMIKKLLDLDEVPKSDDAADALGLAICCVYLLESKRFPKKA
ncbi:crossover junction endodeoxyribonuclease RuvC [Patescibacteria group bacterium]|nr:crossover junction endodeoxyribonuclease RuvC [Patescibacteria group bacterium]MBU4162041.1 crossover junction endodeoxyribonuclease RuvC [Patescibacteria group bacterium]